jgi:hypothetical protein
VRDLQAAAIRKLGGMEYSEERDGRAYGQAVREAVRCYSALPEDS